MDQNNQQTDATTNNQDQAEVEQFIETLLGGEGISEVADGSEAPNADAPANDDVTGEDEGEVANEFPADENDDADGEESEGDSDDDLEV